MDAGKSHLVEKLYQSTGRAALSKTIHLVGRRDIAEEIVQDVFLRLWKKKISFHSDEAAYCWVYRSCHNAGIDYLRSAKHKRETELDDDQAESSHGSNKASHDHGDRYSERQFLKKIVGILGAKEAQVLAYRIVDGMTQSEVADLMQVSRKTIVRLQTKIDAKLVKIRREFQWT